MATLDRDLLFKIAEKLVLDKRNILDSSGWKCATRFMLVNRACKRAFLSQFSLIKTIYLHGSEDTNFDQSCCPHNGSTFYVAAEEDKWMVAFLIQNAKFNPKRIIFKDVFDGSLGLADDSNVVLLQGHSAMQCFSHLLKLKGKFDLSHYQGPKLLLDYLKVEDTEDGLWELDKLVRLDAKEIEVNVSEGESSCLPDVNNFSLADSMRVESFKMVYDSDGLFSSSDCQPAFPTTEWLHLLRYILSSCVNLKKLHVCLHVDDVYDKFPDVLDTLLQVLKAMKDVILPSILRDGCFIQIELICEIDIDDLQGIETKNQELFTIGVPRQSDDQLEICRAVQFNNFADLSFKITYFDDLEDSVMDHSYVDPYDERGMFGDNDLF